MDCVQGREAIVQPRSNAASGPDGDAWNASSEGEKRSGRRPTWLGPTPVLLGFDTLTTTVAFVCCALCAVLVRFQLSHFQKMELRLLLRSKKEFVADFLFGPRELVRATFSEAGRRQLRTCVALYTLELRCSEFFCYARRWSAVTGRLEKQRCFRCKQACLCTVVLCRSQRTRVRACIQD